MDGTLGNATTPDLADSRESRNAAPLVEGARQTSAATIASSGTMALKRATDIVLAALLILLLLPAMVVIAVTIRATSGRQILIRHMRVGRNGLPFACLKFRSMVQDADRMLAAHLARDPAALAEWRAKGKLRNDPRVTPIGRLLRRSSFDELPQLFNVLRGDMSLVGPRPVTATELQAFFPGEAGALYRSVRPGLTGLWQVSGRSGLGYADRIRLDSEYVRKLSLMRDLIILLRTPWVVLTGRGAC